MIGAGIDGIVGAGTTGEFFTLSLDEQARLMSLIAEQVRGRVPLTFGIGNSATSVSIELARHAQELGADCVMLQPPYYFSTRRRRSTRTSSRSPTRSTCR